MYISAFTLLALAASSIAAPETIEQRDEIEKRQGQNNIPQLLSLASLAGITSFPTDPAVLLRLGPLANQLASALPTSPVLSALQTAAPSDFVSNIVNNPSYASSFESAFAAGSSPSWFNSLPTSVRSYLHTYTGFGGLATAAAAFNSVTRSIASASGPSMTGKRSSTAGMTATPTGTDTGASQTGSSASSSSTSGAAAATSASSSVAAAGSAVTGSAAGGDAARPTGAIAAGLAGVIGVLGAVVIL